MNTYPLGFVFDNQGRWITSKDPDDVDFYGLTIADWFPGRNCTGVVVAAQSGVTADNAGTDGQQVTARVAGGTLGQTAYITLRITLDNGAVRDLTLWFLIEAH